MSPNMFPPDAGPRAACLRSHSPPPESEKRFRIKPVPSSNHRLTINHQPGGRESKGNHPPLPPWAKRLGLAGPLLIRNWSIDRRMISAGRRSRSRTVDEKHFSWLGRPLLPACSSEYHIIPMPTEKS